MTSNNRTIIHTLAHAINVPPELREQSEFPEGEIPCCEGSAYRGPMGCTCWEPVYDLEQEVLVNGGAAPEHPETRSKCCHDCAFRNGSPERTEDPDFIETRTAAARAFWCHQGVRRVIAFRHPDGRELPAGEGDYRPPIGPPDNPIVWKADGTPGERCAGWGAHVGVTS